MHLGRPVHPVEQLRRCNRRDRHLLIWAETILQAGADSLHCARGRQAARRPLKLDEDGGV